MGSIYFKNHDTNFYSKYSRLITTITSGMFIVFGYVYHGLTAGFIDAFVANDSSTQLTPLISQISYLLAILFGSWFVIPKTLASLKSI